MSEAGRISASRAAKPSPSPNTHTALTTFTFAPGLNLRALDKNGEPWFVAKDVCAATGHTNPTVAVQSLDADEVAKFNIGNRPANIVSESGLYSLILRSRKPEAKAFQRWVTSEVLPSLRKHGGYILGEEKVVSGEMGEDEFWARAVQGRPGACWSGAVADGQVGRPQTPLRQDRRPAVPPPRQSAVSSASSVWCLPLPKPRP